MNKPVKAPVVLTTNTIIEVPVELIDFDPTQPRTEFDEARLATLADDVRVHGIEQPIELEPDGEKFIIVTGERRYRAACLAELPTIPARLAKAHDTALDKLLRQAAENTQREDLTIVDKARLLRRLRDEHEVRVEDLPELCKTNGIGEWSRPYISNLIRMIDLPEWVLSEISAERMPASAAKHVLQIADLPRAMEEFKNRLGNWLDGSGSEDDGHLREDDIAEIVGYVANELYLPAQNGWAKTAPRYDVEAHKDAVGLRKIDGTEYITDELAHDALQAQHPKPHPKSPAAQYPDVHGKPDTSTSSKKGGDEGEGSSDDKEEKKPRDKLLDVVNPQRIENYVIDWWRQYISLHAREQKLVNAVVSWAAAGAPMNKSAHFGFSMSDRGLSVGQDAACTEFKRKRLGDFLAHDLDDDDRLTLFDRVLEAMDRMPIIDIVAWLQWDFEKCYRIDSDFLAMHTKATLDKLVRDTVAKGKAGTEARQSWNDCVKLDAMRGWCLARAETIGVPKELVKVWRELQARAKG